MPKSTGKREANVCRVREELDKKEGRNEVGR